MSRMAVEQVPAKSTGLAAVDQGTQETPQSYAGEMARRAPASCLLSRFSGRLDRRRNRLPREPEPR
jgi:hypothetical protein